MRTSIRIRPRARPIREWCIDAALFVGIIIGAYAIMASACGCRDATLTAMAAATRTVSAAVPALHELRRAEGEVCFDETSYDAARACIDAVRERWAPVWLALDMLETADEAALEGRVDIATLGRAYCTVARVTELPPLPSELGACR